MKIRAGLNTKAGSATTIYPETFFIYTEGVQKNFDAEGTQHIVFFSNFPWDT